MIFSLVFDSACGGLVWWWQCLHPAQEPPLLPKPLLQSQASEFFFFDLIVLFLLFGFCEGDLLALRPCYDLLIQCACLQGCLLCLPYFF